MLKTLIKKEMIETVYDLRFVIASLLFIILIPLSMFVNRIDYEQRLSAYQQESQIWRARHGTPKWGSKDVEGHGFRAPPVLSVFVLGLDPYLPDKVVTDFSSVFRTVKESNTDRALAVLLGQIDFRFCMVYVVSLMALVFTFNTVSGERERGTLRLLIASSVPRGTLLFCKWLSKTLVLIVPFLVAVCIALLVLNASPQIDLNTPQLVYSIAVILGISLLLIICMTALGVCLSTYATGSLQSITLLLTAWVILVLGIPKVTPMIANIIHRPESRRVIGMRKTILTEDLMAEFYDRREKEVVRLSNQKKKELDAWAKQERAKIQSYLATPKGQEDNQALQRELKERQLELRFQHSPWVIAMNNDLWRQYRHRIPLELEKIEAQYQNQLQATHTLTMVLSRLSCLSCYIYTIADLAGTGIHEPRNYMDNAKRYQEQISQLIYNNIIVNKRSLSWEKGYNPSQAPTFPDMQYARPNLRTIIQRQIWDVSLLVFYSVLFYSLAFFRILKYDVR
jgi:ABC-type transport system involved in multi-copper enzyme maturation permease subunit